MKNIVPLHHKLNSYVINPCVITCLSRKGGGNISIEVVFNTVKFYGKWTNYDFIM